MNAVSKLILFAALLFFGAAPAAHPAEQTSSPLRLLPEAQVSSRGIFLSDIVENPETLGSIRIADAPAFGRITTLVRSQIVEIVHRQLPDLDATNWAGAPRIRISGKTQPLEESMLKELITSTLQKEIVHDRGELELRFARPWIPVPMPDEPLSIRVLDLPNSGVTPNFILRFEILSGAQSAGIWQIPLQARLLRDIWVARSALMRGQTLEASDWVAEKRDVLQLRDAAIAVRMSDDSCELMENISAGSPLLSRSIRPRAIVRRGKLVEALLQDGKLLISIKAEALEDGILGQTIRVRNIASRREFRGKVENEQTIMVTL